MPVLLALVLALSVLSPHSAAAQDFRFTRIEVEGNRRIEAATIQNFLGFELGQEVTAGELNDALQRVVDSGVFEDVEFDPRGSTLVVRVVENPTINRINFEGNRRLDDEALSAIIQSSERRIFNPAQAERDASLIAEAYSAQGRIAARVTPRIIRRSENRVDLIYEIAEGDTIEIERISFVGNRAFSDRRLRQVLDTKQAGLLRTFIRADTFIEDRIEFDLQLLRDFYLSRGYVDFRVNSSNVEFTRERDAFFLVIDIQEGQQFRFGQITTTSEIPTVDAAEFQDALNVRPGVVFSPTVIENSIARQERLAVRQGIDFLRVEPRVTRNDRDLTLDVDFLLTRGPRIFIERIDIEGNTTTLDRVIRNQFRVVEGDPFNPREIREAAERIRALGFFANAEVDGREGTSPDRVIVDVNVEEQPTGSLNLGGSYSVTDGIGIAIGLSENNFLGRGQRLALSLSTAQDAERYVLGFTEPNLLGRNLIFDFDVGIAGRTSSFASYDSERAFFFPRLRFPISENSSLTLRYGLQAQEMLARDPNQSGPVITREIGLGRRTDSSIGWTYTFDSRLTGLNPSAGYLIELSADYAGIGGDNTYIRSSGRLIGQTRVLREDVILRATLEGGALRWRGDNTSRAVDRFLLNPDTFRGFEPGGIGPRDKTGTADDPLGGNLYAVARFEAEFPIGLPEEVGLRAGVFYDVGNLWDLDFANTSGAVIVGEGGSFRHVIGVSLIWDSAFGPLRFNFSNALVKEEFDRTQAFEFTINTRF